MTDSSDIEDIETVAAAVRIVRAARLGDKGKDIIRRMKEEYPDYDDQRIRNACRKAADLLIAQHS